MPVRLILCKHILIVPLRHTEMHLFLLICLAEFVSDCQWIGCKMREKHRRLKKKGVRVVRASSHHHKRKVKKSSKEGSCDENNIKSCSECLGYSGNDHPSSRIEPESEPVNFEEGEGLKSEITEMLVQNQPTPGCEDVKLNNEGTIMAASVRSDDCSSTSLSNTTTSSPSLVGGASIAQNKNTTSMVRFVADVTAPDLTSFSPGKLSDTGVRALHHPHCFFMADL